MKTMKSILAVLMAICLVACLAVSVAATEAETTVATTEAAGADAPTSNEETEAPTEAPTEDEHAGHNHGDEETTDEVVTTGEAEEPAAPSVWRIILIVLEVIASVGLILVVLLQSGKESGLGSAMTGNSDSYMNKSKAGGLDKVLASATKWIALGWVVITVLLVVVVKN